MGDYLSWALPVGSVAGIRIRLHLVLLVWWLFQLERYLKFEGVSRPSAFLYWGLAVGITGIAILLHEFGHCYAARRVGGQADEVLLWPLGGLAFCNAPNLPRSQFLVAAGGPAVPLVIAIAANLYFFLAPQPEGSAVYVTAKWALIHFHNPLLIINLVPMYPLDGGRMFQAGLWAYYAPRESAGAYGRPSLMTVYVSRVCAVLWALVAIFYLRSWLFGLIAIWSWMSTDELYRRIRQGDGEDYAFGYDFSRGYTSLEGESQPSPRRERSGGGGSGWLKGFKRRVDASREPTAEEKERVDALLDKISRDGMDSLNREEQRFLKRVSKRGKRES